MARTEHPCDLHLLLPLMDRRIKPSDDAVHSADCYQKHLAGSISTMDQSAIDEVAKTLMRRANTWNARSASA
jgi:hypothetical protein